MLQQHPSFRRWAEQAAAHIRFPGDRPAVIRELTEHMEDRRDAFLAEGLSKAEAEKAALAAMGDADETGKALALIHRPFLGYLYKAAKIALLASAAMLLLVSCARGFNMPYYYGFSEPYSDLATESTATHVREITYLSPTAKAECGGYTFTLPSVMHRRFYDLVDGTSHRSLYFVLEAFHPSPAAFWPGGVRECIYAVDDLGNLYPNRCFSERYGEDEGREVCGNGTGRTLLRYRYEMWVSCVAPDAQWVELRYERLNCSFSLRIPLVKDGELL